MSSAMFRDATAAAAAAAAVMAPMKLLTEVAKLVLILGFMSNIDDTAMS